MDASRVATRPGARWAPAMAATAATGLCFCGRVDEPPRPGTPSATSPTSVWASSTMSRAGFASAPAATPSAPASSPIRVRSVCQGRTGACRPSSRAIASATRRPWPSKAAQGPGRAAELDRQAQRLDVSEIAGRAVEPAHPAGSLEPEGRGNGLLQQGASGDGGRPVIASQERGGVRRATRGPRRWRPGSGARSTSWPCPRCPGSWRHGAPDGAMSSPTATRSRRTRGTTGVPVAAVSPPMASTSSVNPCPARSIAWAWAAGMSPAFAAERARAISTSTIAWSHAPGRCSVSGPGREPAARSAVPRDQRSKKAVASSPCRRMSKR